MILARIDYLARRRKVLFRVDYLKFFYLKKRAFAGMSSIEKADGTLRRPSVLAELAEEDFLVCGCLFQFRCFSKIKYDIFFYSLVLRLRTVLAAI